MEFKDHSAEIAAVSQNYAGHKLPLWLTRMQELVQQILQSLQEFLNTLFQMRSNGGIGDNRSLSTLLQFGLYLAGFVAFLAILYLLWKRVTLARTQAVANTRGAASIEKILGSQGYRQEAEKSALAGDFKGACRNIYLCLLQDMHERSVAAFAPTKTNYEYRYLLGQYPGLQSAFMKLAEIVESVWFGNKRAETSDYNECLGILAQALTESEKIGNQIALARKAEEEAY